VVAIVTYHAICWFLAALVPMNTGRSMCAMHQYFNHSGTAVSHAGICNQYNLHDLPHSPRMPMPRTCVLKSAIPTCATPRPTITQYSNAYCSFPHNCMPYYKITYAPNKKTPSRYNIRVHQKTPREREKCLCLYLLQQILGCTHVNIQRQRIGNFRKCSNILPAQ